MRPRDWRRYKQDVILIRRLKYFLRTRYYHFADINGNRLTESTFMGLIGSLDYKFLKSNVTTRYDSRSKSKYSNKFHQGDRNHVKKNKDSLGTRLLDKKEFNKILKELGIKPNYTN